MKFSLSNYMEAGRRFLPAMLLGFVLVCGGPAAAAPDEIQVYTDDLNAPGEAELEVHTNFVTKGRKTPDYPGERAPYQVLRVTPELSFGLAENWDMGFYLPMAYSADGGYTVDGGKLRLKYLRHSETLFYGVNLEIGYSPRRVAENYWNSELRTIFGIKRGDWLLAVNPVFGWDMSGGGEATPDFDLAFKAMRETGGGLAFGVEHYAELGKADHIHVGRESGQSTYAVMEYEGKGWELNLGVGHGWTDVADKTVVKAIFTVPFK